MYRYEDMVPPFRGRFKVFLDFIQRNLNLIATVLLVLTISLIIITVIVANQRDGYAEQLVEEKKRVCLKPECVKQAASIIKNMDPSADPCDDFYQFSCGGFMNNTFIPDDQYAVTTFNSVRNLVYQQIRKMLEEPSQPDQHKPFALTKKFYSTCVNTTAIEADGLETIRNILDKLGGWPLLQNSSWYGGKFDWKQLIYTLRNTGYSANYFVSITIMKDLKNSSKRVISIDQAELELPRPIFLQEYGRRVLQVHLDYMTDIAELLGANRVVAAEELEEALNLQIALANISLSKAKRKNETLLYNPMTVAKLRMVYPNTDWKQYIKYFLDIPDFKISEDEIVIVREPQYLHDLENVLNQTTKRTQANYIMWRVVSSSVDCLSEELRDRKAKYIEAIAGIKQSLPRWKQCIYHTLQYFWKPLRAFYDQIHFSQKSRNTASEIMSNIHAEFTKILQNTEWMDEDTRKAALEKIAVWTVDAQAFGVHENLTDYYAGLNLDSDNFLMTALAVSLFNNNEYYKRLRKPVGKKRNPKKDVSMEYRIFVLGGLFQEIFFDSEQPHYMNYGAVGSLIGHLLTHGFDSTGRQFDKDGDLAEWWTNQTEIAFDERAACFVEQYNNYTMEDLSLKLNGKNTRDENIADNGGTKTAYLAYQAWTDANGPEPLLPGLNYTVQQMFWISAANVHCSKYQEEQLRMIVLLANIAPEYYKVIGTFSNSEYFAKDFNCPLGSRMNPEKKCKVW